jgi:hypothetical protein
MQWIMMVTDSAIHKESWRIRTCNILIYLLSGEPNSDNSKEIVMNNLSKTTSVNRLIVIHEFWDSKPWILTTPAHTFALRRWNKSVSKIANSKVKPRNYLQDIYTYFSSLVNKKTNK